MWSAIPIIVRLDKRYNEFFSNCSKKGDISVTLVSNSGQLDELTKSLELQRARTEELAAVLAIEQIYTLKLAKQLRQLSSSRLWRAVRWLRRLFGRATLEPDFERPSDKLPVSVMSDVFRKIYFTNSWASDDSHSGRGSDLVQTAEIREVLPGLLNELGVRSMLDLPCGDFHWMRMLELDVEYIGADVVSDLIGFNNLRYSNERRRFQILDILYDDIPKVDLVLCRDLLVHFSFIDAFNAIRNIKRSGSTYLLTTTFPKRTSHDDILTGHWRVLNLELPPFNFPKPLRLINEKCTEQGMDVEKGSLQIWLHGLRQNKLVLNGNGWSDKSLGLWRLADL
jgi:hypothetical protein